MTKEKGTVAVIFVSKRAAVDPEGYGTAATAMMEAAAKFPGYRGVHSARGADGVGITVSYWASEEAARAWKMESEHAATREKGRSTWYEWYEMVIAEVTRSYDWRQPGA
jgi:heme-degrading monooxygenase HmoA